MDDSLRARYQMHSRTRSFARRVEQARHIISQAMETASSWYVAFSTGKDSTVVLHLVREQAPDVPAHHSLHQWMLPESAAYLASISNLRKVAYQDYDGTDWAQRWSSRADAEASGARWLEVGEIETRGAQEAGVFLGLRAEESAARRVHLRTFGSLHYAAKTRTWQCNPIAWWTVNDVWSYIISRNVSYSAAYDRLSVLGVPPEQQRIGPLAVGGVLGYGQLAILKRGWPDLFNRYAEAHPEARSYV